MKKIVAIIPSRYASTRLPGKPLIDLEGKTMIQRVYEQCLLSNQLSDVIVATDDERIFEHLTNLGAKVMMTASHHQNGTERIAELAINLNADYIINIQGDEPLINPLQIDELINFILENPQFKIASLAHDIDYLNSPNIMDIENAVKVYFSDKNKACFFFRTDQRGTYLDFDIFERANLGKHIGIYIFNRNTLLDIVKLPPSPKEIEYSLEQYRWLENGIDIGITWTKYESISVDVPEDVEKVRAKLRAITKDKHK